MNQGVSSNPPLDPQCSSSQQLPFTGAEAQARDEDSVCPGPPAFFSDVSALTSSQFYCCYYCHHTMCLLRIIKFGLDAQFFCEQLGGRALQVNGCGNDSDRNDNRADSDEYEEEEEDDDYYGQGYDDLMDRDALAGDSTPAGSDADDCNQTHAAVCLDEEVRVPRLPVRSMKCA